MAKAKPVPAAAPRRKLNLNFRRYGDDLAFGALIAELLGTFALTFALLNFSGNAIVAAVAYLVLLLAVMQLSGGHLNPGVTVGLLATRRISWVKALTYVVAQFLGAMLAVVIVATFLKGSTIPNQFTGASEPAHVFTVTVNGTWKPFFAELIGALVFGFGVASSIFNKKVGFEAAFTMGGALLVGLFIAAIGSSAILNPAVALGVGALDLKNVWGLIAYALAPVLGAGIGMLLYQLLLTDETRNIRRA
jgi:aquaporin Z